MYLFHIAKLKSIKQKHSIFFYIQLKQIAFRREREREGGERERERVWSKRVCVCVCVCEREREREGKRERFLKEFHFTDIEKTE